MIIVGIAENVNQACGSYILDLLHLKVKELVIKKIYIT